MKRNLTCIVCPLGCSLEAELDGKNVVSVSGNTCPRGAKYAESECTNPERTITTTVRCSNGEVVPVKTITPVPKAKMFECMAEINKAIANLPIHRGDVIINGVAGTNVNVVATADMGVYAYE